MNNLDWVCRNCFRFLRISMGIIYLWFGALKYFPQLSPADQLAKDTIELITFGLIPQHVSILMLAFWETVLGVMLLIGWWRNYVYYALMLHITCTFLPLFFFQQVSFTASPYAFTLVGQYIMKNLLLLSAMVTLQAYYTGKIKLQVTTGN
jgi:uncharacterized membrane protein YphA (DoxX/SURF4 family)